MPRGFSFNARMRTRRSARSPAPRMSISTLPGRFTERGETVESDAGSAGGALAVRGSGGAAAGVGTGVGVGSGVGAGSGSAIGAAISGAGVGLASVTVGTGVGTAALAGVCLLPIYGVHAYGDIGLQVLGSGLVLSVALAAVGRVSSWSGAWPERNRRGRPRAANRAAKV